MKTVRPPAVAGLFYPARPDELRAVVAQLIQQASAAVSEDERDTVPKAIIAPHAGYVYSGPVAASAYARLKRGRGRIRRVVLLGPAHFVPFEGLAASSAESFRTPLGDLRVDTEALQQCLELEQVHLLDAAHEREHSLEVHLPFVQVALGDVTIVPLLVGDASPEEVAEVIETLWDGPETVFVISSDLSHYHDYATARMWDAETTQIIEHREVERLSAERACGYKPIAGLLCVAERHGLNVRTLDLRNSGDTAGPRDRVVGYGSYVVA